MPSATNAKDNAAPKTVCRWCERADRKVNVQGFCCQLCYNSWLSDRADQGYRRYVEKMKQNRNTEKQKEN